MGQKGYRFRFEFCVFGRKRHSVRGSNAASSITGSVVRCTQRHFFCGPSIDLRVQDVSDLVKVGVGLPRHVFLLPRCRLPARKANESKIRGPTVVRDRGIEIRRSYSVSKEEKNSANACDAGVVLERALQAFVPRGFVRKGSQPAVDIRKILLDVAHFVCVPRTPSVIYQTTAVSRGRKQSRLGSSAEIRSTEHPVVSPFQRNKLRHEAVEHATASICGD